MSNSGVHSGAMPIIDRYCLRLDETNNDGSKSAPKLSAFIIRLTDASLKTLTDAIAESKREKSKMIPGYVEIQSNGIEGILSFGGNPGIQHHFSMMDAQRDLGPTGQLEAITESKMMKKMEVGEMKSIGSITKRLNISATTQDTFEKTKQKAKLADEEMRKNAAKVLKGPTAGGDGRGRKKLLEKITKLNAPTLARPLTPMGHRSISPGNLKAKTPVAAKKGSAPIDTAILKRSLRDRILYRLFLAPSTPQEMLTKLGNEGLSEKDRAEFESIFNEVGQIRGGMDGQSIRNGTYEVKKALITEIKPDDWPFYSAWERQTCRRLLAISAAKKQQNPSHGTTGSESADDTDDGTQRVKAKLVPRAPPPKRHGQTVEIAQKSAAISPIQSISPTTEAIAGVSAVTISESEPPRKKMAVEIEANTKNALEDTMKKFEFEFPPIRSITERKRYKEVFDKDYPIYMAAYDRLRALALEFENLGDRLKNAPKSSDDRRAVEKDILGKYKEFENDPEIQTMRRNHEELKVKLHVLKMRVKEFDDTLGPAAESGVK